MKDGSKSQRLWVLCLAAALFFWSSAYIGIRIGLTGGYTPGAMALFRYAVASICILLMYLRLPKRQRVSGQDAWRLFGLGVIGFAVYNIALNVSEITVPASIVSFVISLTPVFLTLFAILFLGERIRWLGAIGVLVSAGGVLLIAIGEHAGVEFDIGVIYALICAIAAAVYSAGQKPLLKKFHPIELVTYAIWSGTLVMLFYLPQLLHEIPHATTAATLATIYNGMFPAAFAYAAWSYLLHYLPASKAAGYLFIAPLITTLLGWLILGNIPAWLSLVGGFVALAGAVIVHISKHTESKITQN